MTLPFDDPKEILRMRARALAQTAHLAPAEGKLIELIEFRLAEERYAIESIHVQEVCTLKELTPLPCTPLFVRGIVNVRGHIFPVLDLKRFFDLPEQGITDLHRIILVRRHDMELGLLADSVVGVQLIPLESLQSSLPTLTGIRAEYLKGVTADGLVVLEMTRILSDPKIVVAEEVDT
jgi:purine-binding chemotaxis protein CheW